MLPREFAAQNKKSSKNVFACRITVPWGQVGFTGALLAAPHQVGFPKTHLWRRLSTPGIRKDKKICLHLPLTFGIFKCTLNMQLPNLSRREPAHYPELITTSNASELKRQVPASGPRFAAHHTSSWSEETAGRDPACWVKHSVFQNRQAHQIAMFLWKRLPRGPRVFKLKVVRHVKKAKGYLQSGPFESQ